MEPFVGQIKTFGFGFNPRGYALCNGQVMPIQQNMALYSLISTQFGGDGRTSFNLPDLQGRVPLGANYLNRQYLQGSHGGYEGVTLSTSTMPAHTHNMNASNTAASFPLPSSTSRLASPQQKWANGSTIQLYGANVAPVPLAGDAIGTAGGGQPHNNMQPSTVVNFCIALTGYYPQRS